MDSYRFEKNLTLWKKPKPCAILSEVRGSEATEAESKDPEDMSSAMQRQGVLLRMRRANIFGPCETAITTRSGFTSWEAAAERFTRE